MTLIGVLIALAAPAYSFVKCPDDLPDVRISTASSSLNPVGYEGPGDEYVCLVNEDDGSISITGWELHAAERRVNTLPKFSLEPGEAVRVHPGEGTDSAGDLFGERGSPSWRNEGGEITLLDDEGEEIDSEGYGERSDGDGTGECGPGARLELEITSPDDGDVVRSAKVAVRGTVTSDGVVRAKLDHDDESESGGTLARVINANGVGNFAVVLPLDLGENSIRVEAEKAVAEPVVEFLGVIRMPAKTAPPPPPPPPPCDPNYEGACLDPNAVDYDCAGGEGDGPNYVEGPIRIVGDDRFDLDRGGDGVACEP